MKQQKCDLLVIGAGAGGLTAALRAADAGLDVVVAEKDEYFGGATARSAGGIWIPCNPHAAAMGGQDSREKALTYFRNQAGPRFDPQTVSAFLDNGPEMLKFVERASTLRFAAAMGYGDYHCEAPGGETSRVLFPQPWDGAELDQDLKRLRPMLRRAQFLGIQISVLDVGLFMSAGRKLGSAAYVFGSMLRRLRDQFRAGRSLRLTGGNALAAGLAAACLRNGVKILTSAPARRLLHEGNRVSGAVLDSLDGQLHIEARYGVILCTGGYAHDAGRRAETLPAIARSAESWSLYPYGSNGDGIRMGEAVGALFDCDMAHPVALAPMTRLAAGEGVMEVSPLFFFRGAPGVISVTRDGKRFVNEARSYHDWSVGLLAATAGEEPVAWVVCDHRAIRRYGLGIVKPAPFPVRPHLRSGYLTTGCTLGDLARSAGIDPDGLERTVSEFNEAARLGRDPQFGRGSTAYEMVNGDPEHRPNPCVGPLDKGPYYAVRALPGCLGTFAGLKGDENARVVDADGSPIPGLYVAGNDMASITGGDYIAGGCTLGPAMTFGFIAANHVIRRHKEPEAVHADSAQHAVQ
ncbi:FAD-dependent oxidoreductase [Sphingobium fluviale]|uniref:FAD-dependent oxidoreductase n=1 Tax=Sphingobium fluviale TaxID=2506423 RepID=A0A4Q1KCP5_9SPHN|nr:FAD-dependent oxidoreductase [Sphingobium fluviale]RXR24722.1 FAD-dependent oxidoreductase [Sphingobium fluviale]